eukprot:3326832-Rhodomonas_salina.1
MERRWDRGSREGVEVRVRVERGCQELGRRLPSVQRQLHLILTPEGGRREEIKEKRAGAPVPAHFNRS